MNNIHQKGLLNRSGTLVATGESQVRVLYDRPNYCNNAGYATTKTNFVVNFRLVDQLLARHRTKHDNQGQQNSPAM